MIEASATTRLRLNTGVDAHAQLCVTERGDRRRCLLLHGNPGSLRDWQALTPLLSSALDLVTLDLPGFGQSPRLDVTPESLGLERLADHVVAVADALAWHEPFYVLGHSHGGGVAQVVAARHPDRIAGLVLIGTLGAPAHASYRLLSLPGAETVTRLAGAMFRAPRFRWLGRTILRQVMRDIFAPDPVPPDKLESELNLFANRPEILVAMVHLALGRPSDRLLDAARQIRCPTLFLHGEADALVPWRFAHALHERLVAAGNDSHWQGVPGAGHMLIDNRASDLVEPILRSLSRWSARDEKQG
jgi:pimeloyl-ACP methyl ester carboxylesterase